MPLAELVTLTGEDNGDGYPDDIFTGNLPAIRGSQYPQLSIGNSVIDWVKTNPLIVAGIAVAGIYIFMRLSKGKNFFKGGL